VDQNIIDLFHKLADCSLTEREDYYVRHHVAAEQRAEIEALLRFDKTTNQSVAGHVAFVAREALEEEGATQVMKPEERLSHRSAPAAPDFFEGRFLPGAIVAQRYRIVNLLGRGGMGEVYRAMDLTLGQTVALKFLPEGVSHQSLARERLFNEVRAAREITHPQVCRVHDVGEMDGQFYISMEFVDGEDLASLLSRIGRLPLKKASELAAGICAGLSAAHLRGLIHRDLKPANIMVDGRGQPRLMDFGLTASVGKIAQSEVAFGTPMYMAPEQLAGKEVSPRSDLYALGLILYELFTGRHPFEGKSIVELLTARQTITPAPMSTLCPEVTAPVEAVVAACLSPDPARRPASANAVAAALPYQDALAAVIAAGDTPSPELIAASGDTKVIRPFLAYGAAAVILCALVSLFFLKARGNGEQRPSPEVLQQSAQALARKLGYPADPADTGYGFERGGSIGNPYLRFWYRESDRELQPSLLVNFLSVPGQLTPSDPPMQPGMRLVEMDARGRLIRFTAIPRPAPAVAPQVDWKILFDSAGLDSSKFSTTSAEWHVPVATDGVVQWVGKASPDGPSLLVTGASLAGQGVFFEVKDAARGAEVDFPFIQQITPAATVFLICGVVALAWKARSNLLRQRADRQGAFRLGAAMFCICAGEWVCLGRHSFTVREAVRASGALSWALAMGVVVCLGYLAIDPMARRIFPDMLVSLQQVLMGGRRDANLGRDILGGLGAAAVISVMIQIVGQKGMRFGYDYSTPKALAGIWLGDLRLGVWIGLSLLMLLVALLGLLGKKRIRRGALAIVIAETVLFCLKDMPAVHDVSDWYAQAPLLGYAALALLTVYGARLAAGAGLPSSGSQTSV
jgi:hypothetical protein